VNLGHHLLTLDPGVRWSTVYAKEASVVVDTAPRGRGRPGVDQERVALGGILSPARLPRNGVRSQMSSSRG
jgi:hypothetical protein